MKLYPPALPHGSIQEIFPDIFFVTGASIFEHEGNVIQKSNNMVIVRNGKELTLINTLRLNEDGLNTLNKIGKVANVVMLGAFHDRHGGILITCDSIKNWTKIDEYFSEKNGQGIFGTRPN